MLDAKLTELEQPLGHVDWLSLSVYHSFFLLFKQLIKQIFKTPIKKDEPEKTKKAKTTARPIMARRTKILKRTNFRD